ncbi:acetylornithine transaminase [Candidatus Alkanophaga liquidiphilum]|nr:Acetylornithine/succinyldiaminopimelate/putrescine aminotransferase [Candidatus Alkanophaga liquidiphilum]
MEALQRQEVMEKERQFIMQTYSRLPVLIVEGRGVVVKDADGREYVDCVAGIAVNSVGHCHPRVVAAIKAQAERLIHLSNLFYTEPQVELAEKLCRLAKFEKVFFCNSGAESVEAALKLARKVTGKKGFIAAQNSFHGRTFGALSVTHHVKRDVFEPLLHNVKFVRYGDADAVRKAIDEDTAAVILEPIQGEAGVIIPPLEYLREVKEICEKHDALFILDEVQTGFGRTGRWFCKEHFKVQPDIMAVAKALGGGFPIGATLSNFSFERGEHASTFGGNPLACAAALATLGVIEEEQLVERSERLGAYFMQRLSEVIGDYDSVKEIRGKGLMLGVELQEKCENVVNEALKRGVLLNCTADRVIRLVPPLVISEKQIDGVVKILSDILKGFDEG